MTTLALALLGIYGALFTSSQWGAHAIERQYPAHGKFVSVDGVELHYIEQGEGIPLVLLHGANSNLRDFQASLVPHLAPHYRVLVFDRPGYGYSERPEETEWLDPNKQVALILKACAQMGAVQPFLVGHSWAGSMVMSAAVNYESEIRGGVLLSAVTGHWAGPLGVSYSLSEKPLLRHLMAQTVAYPLGRVVLPQAIDRVFEPNEAPEAYAESIGAKLALRPASFRNNAVDMNNLNIFMQTLSRSYRDIQKPLLALHGAADELVPFWNHGRRLQESLPSLQVELLPDLGHAPHHVRPAEIAAHITRFIDQHESPL